MTLRNDKYLQLNSPEERYDSCTTPESINYTYEATAFIFDALSKHFDGISFFTEGRIKSKTSFIKKVKDNPSKIIHDIFGCKSIIWGISTNCDNPEELYKKHGISGFVSKRDSITESIQSKRRHLFDLRRNCDSENNSEIYNKIYQELIAECEQHLLSLYNHYNDVDNMCQTHISDDMYDYIRSIFSNPNTNPLGLYTLSERDKRFNNPNGYVANHVTFASTKIHNWFLEWQFKSLHDYDVERFGSAAHSKRKGKELMVPHNMSSEESNDYLLNIPQNDVPKYFIVQRGDTDDTTTIFIPGFFSNLYQKLQPIFESHKNIAEELHRLIDLTPGRIITINTSKLHRY